MCPATCHCIPMCFKLLLSLYYIQCPQIENTDLSDQLKKEYQTAVKEFVEKLPGIDLKVVSDRDRRKENEEVDQLKAQLTTMTNTKEEIESQMTVITTGKEEAEARLAAVTNEKEEVSFDYMIIMFMSYVVTISSC